MKGRLKQSLSFQGLYYLDIIKRFMLNDMFFFTQGKFFGMLLNLLNTLSCYHLTSYTKLTLQNKLYESEPNLKRMVKWQYIFANIYFALKITYL